MKTTPPSYLQLARDGLWNQNQALVALLGLCPLLAVSTSLINGLALGLRDHCDARSCPMVWFRRCASGLHGTLASPCSCC